MVIYWDFYARNRQDSACLVRHGYLCAERTSLWKAGRNIWFGKINFEMCFLNEIIDYYKTNWQVQLVIQLHSCWQSDCFGFFLYYYILSVSEKIQMPLLLIKMKKKLFYRSYCLLIFDLQNKKNGRIQDPQKPISKFTWDWVTPSLLMTLGTANLFILHRIYNQELKNNFLENVIFPSF